VNLFSIDDILEEMALEGKTHFAPHYINTRGGFNDLEGVTKYLLKEVGTKLEINFEIECPEGDSDFAIDTLDEIPSEERECSICGILYTPSSDNVWVSFDFTSEYRNHIKKKYMFSPLKVV